ncbi:MAG: histidine phosphatase family protein [Alphaproteobacteria bacterium]|nr:histidine phosphatase family protein [Alphaproteobacteria bacterium]
MSRAIQTAANAAHRFSGCKDTPLTPLGLEQAARVGAILRGAVGPRPALSFVSSPLARARRTMEIARAELDLAPDGFAVDPRLEEIDLGDWDQLTDAEARALDPATFDRRMADKWDVRVPGGENYAQVAARVTDWFRGLKADTFAVSHGATTRILRGLLAGLDAAGMSGLDEPQGVVFRVRGGEVVRLDP